MCCTVAQCCFWMFILPNRIGYCLNCISSDPDSAYSFRVLSIPSFNSKVVKDFNINLYGHLGCLLIGLQRNICSDVTIHSAHDEIHVTDLIMQFVYLNFYKICSNNNKTMMSMCIS